MSSKSCEDLMIWKEASEQTAICHSYCHINCLQIMLLFFI